MADLAITADNVRASVSAVRARGVAGAALTAGMPLYKDSTDGNRLKPCDADALASAACVGVALHAAADEQPIEYAESDPAFTVGGTLTKGLVYCVSTTAGGVAPSADIASGDFLTTLYVPISTTQAILRPQASGVAT